MTDGKRFLLTALYAAWVIAFAYAFVAYHRAPAEGAGFVAGLNRPMVYLGWQGIAGTIAVGLFGVGRTWSKGSGVRALATVPLVIAVLHLAAIGAVSFWAKS